MPGGFNLIVPQMFDQRIEALVARNDVKMGVGVRGGGAANVVREREIEGVLPGGKQAHEVDIGGVLRSSTIWLSAARTCGVNAATSGREGGRSGRSPLCIAAEWSFAGGVESKLEGNWQMVRAELAGEAAPELVTTNMILTFAVCGYEVRFGGLVSDRGTFVVDATAGQRTLLLTGVEGPNTERTIPCIFQLTKDRLRVCYGLDGILPEGFSAQVGEARYLAIYRRTTPP